MGFFPTAGYHHCNRPKARGGPWGASVPCNISNKMPALKPPSEKKRKKKEREGEGSKEAPNVPRRGKAEVQDVQPKRGATHIRVFLYNPWYGSKKMFVCAAPYQKMITKPQHKTTETMPTTVKKI